MPRRDGLELLRPIRRTGNDKTAIWRGRVTRITEEGAYVRCRQLGSYELGPLNIDGLPPVEEGNWAMVGFLDGRRDDPVLLRVEGFGLVDHLPAGHSIHPDANEAGDGEVPEGDGAGGWIYRVPTDVSAYTSVHRTRRAFTTLVNKTSGAVDEWVDWGTPLTLPDLTFPAGTIEVLAQVTGRMAFDSATASRRVGECRVGISLDNTWSYGQEVSIEVRGGDARRVAVTNQHFLSAAKIAGTAARVKVQCRQTALGVAGDLVFGDGSLSTNHALLDPNW